MRGTNAVPCGLASFSLGRAEQSSSSEHEIILFLSLPLSKNHRIPPLQFPIPTPPIAALWPLCGPKLYQESERAERMSVGSSEQREEEGEKKTLALGSAAACNHFFIKFFLFSPVAGSSPFCDILPSYGEREREREREREPRSTALLLLLLLLSSSK